jgi:tetratricopeptide (TPR) repeat protein
MDLVEIELGGKIVNDNLQIVEVLDADVDRLDYSNRIKSDRAKNLEQSIKCFRAALEVFNSELFPHEWAKIQINLAQFSIAQLQNYQFATEHLQSAYAQLSENNNDTGLLAATMFELARCFHKTGCLVSGRNSQTYRHRFLSCGAVGSY